MTKATESNIKEVEANTLKENRSKTKNLSSKNTKQSNLIRNLAFASIGTIAQGISRIEKLIDEASTRRDNLFKELIQSGEEFTESKQQQFKKNLKKLTSSINSDEDSKEKSDEKVDIAA